MTLYAHPAPPEVVASLQEIVDTIKHRHRAKQAQALAHYVPMAVKSVEERRGELQAELAAAQLGFDPAYAFSDDHTFWREQLAKAETIGRCRVELAKLDAVAA